MGNKKLLTVWRNGKECTMKIRSMITAMFVVSLIAGCYPGISGRVIDAETQMPIEGAVVLAQWTDSHGIGLTYHTVHKIIETETNKDGTFSLSGVYSPFVDPPVLIIYKNGYVAWRNDFVFPEYKKQTDYDVWKNRYTYKLDRFKDEYSKNKHQSFISLGVAGDSLAQTPMFNKIYADTLEEALQEIKMKKK